MVRIMCFTALVIAVDTIATQHFATVNTFDWSSILPSRDLHYKPCYDGLQCARLDVLLNWNDSKQTDRIAIAIARLPAKVPITDPRYGGAILINPGGPGESGIDELTDRGRAIQTIIDATPSPSDDDDKHFGADSQDKYFDIIGFDPRGVKYSTPRLNCFPDAFAQQLWLLGYTDYALMWESDASIALEFARTKALSRSCAEHDQQNLIRHVNTAQVVQDVIEIVERHGAWREAEAGRLWKQLPLHNQQVVLHGSHSTPAIEESESARKRLAYRPGEEKLQYWGVSYGTLLGQTIAAMHPDRVGRMVIDGVLDPDDYYNGTWLANLQDSNRIMEVLCQLCFEAGPAKCPMYTGSSAADIEREVRDFVFGFKPMVAISPGSNSPEVVTYRDVYLQAIGAMHAPFARAEGFFELLAELQQGNTSKIAVQKAAQMQSTASLAACANKELSPDGCFPDHTFGLLTSTPVIECMDSAHSGNRNLTIHDFKAYFAELTTQSNWLAASWARHRLSCVGMVTEPAWQYEGTISGNTSHPLLIIGNTYDTVTPIGNARKVSRLFPGSIVLRHDSEGHCSHANPSLCTATKVREYFQTGKLPERGTVCQPEYRPFVGYSDRAWSAQDHEQPLHSEMWEAQKKLSQPRRGLVA